MYDPIPSHEDAHARKLEAEQNAYDSLLAYYELEIKVAFTSDICKYQRIFVPYVQGTQFKTQPISEAVSDMVSGDPEILRLLMDVLHASDCPLVEKLRKAMGEDYAKTWADVLASLGE